MPQYLEPAIIADLSRWNGTPSDLQFRQAIAATPSLVGVIIKHTQGLAKSNPSEAAQAYNFYRATLPQFSNGISAMFLEGAYHFGTSAADPTDQATFFYNEVRAAYPAADPSLTGLLLALDLEGNADNTMAVDDAAAFVERIDQLTGRLPVLYMGRLGPDNRGTGLPNRLLSMCDLWLPAYGDHPDLAPILPPGFRMPTRDDDRGGCVRLWQFTDGTTHGGPVPGLGKVDQSRAVGFSSVFSLASWWGR